MSQARALSEMDRFLSTSSPEMLSISGRCGVGKTHAWDEALKARRSTAGSRRYSYVPVFGLGSIEGLKTAIVQSTVSLQGNELEPILDSFIEHMSSMEGARTHAGEAARRIGRFRSRRRSTFARPDGRRLSRQTR